MQAQNTTATDAMSVESAGGIPEFTVKDGFDGQVIVDLSSEIGPIKIHNAVNGAPPLSGSAYFDGWKEAEFPYARTHDLNLLHGYGGPYIIDVPWIFRNFDADENDPANYDFTCTDAILKRIQDGGTKIFYRLGAAFEYHLVKKYTLYPPKDFSKWARIAEHIIRHYTEGWADGYKWDIDYWEIWNEPNLNTSKTEGVNGNFWRGSRDQFKELFKISLKHLKSCFPHFKFGGPAMCGTGHSWSEEIVSEFALEGVPLDFYSWHRYDPDFKRFSSDARFIRNLLDKYGYTNAESICSEWNYVKGWSEGEFAYSLQVEKGVYNQKGAAFLAAAMTVLQAEKVDMSLFYDVRYSGMNNLFDPITGLPLRGYYPFIAWRNLRRLGTQVQAVSSLDDVYITAAKGKDGRWGFLVIRYDEDNNVTAPVRILIKLQGGGSFQDARCHLTDDFRIYTEKGITVDEDGSAELVMRPCSFAYFEGGR